MEKVEYTSEIVSLIQKGEKLEAIAEIRKKYGISLVEAKNMVNTYKGGEEFYFLSTDDNDKTIETNSSISEATTTPKEVIPFACPNCGSTCVHKSMGGKAENVAAVVGAKLIKKAVLGDNSKYVRGEGKLINESVPFQQTCDYCHYTFHASQSQIDNGKYSMNKRIADDLHSSYNKKLQMVKDKEVSGIKNKASQKMKKVIGAFFVFLLGLLICMNCDHTTEGVFGLTAYTGSFMFSCFLIFLGVALTFVFGVSWLTTYNMASTLESMSIEQYAKTHKA